MLTDQYTSLLLLLLFQMFTYAGLETVHTFFSISSLTDSTRDGRLALRGSLLLRIFGTAAG